MKNVPHTKSTGFVLIEALVALLVVSVGVLGISKLNALLMQGTGSAKTQAEALQIAQGLIEDLRDFNLQSACTATTLDVGTNTLPDVTGINAVYSAQTTVSAGATAALRNIEACITWNGGDCDATANINRVILRSVISCEGMGTSAMTGPDGAAALRGNFVKTPTGRGVVTGEQYDPTNIPGNNNTITVDGTTYNDGTKTYNNTAKGTLELIGSDGKVLLSVQKYGGGCESAPPAFSTITGKVLVEAKNGNPIAADNNLFVLSSDASFCAKVPRQASWVLPAGATGNNIEYFYTYYQCYLGAEWWGNIGLVRTDNATANERVCVGSPVNGPSSLGAGTLFSKEAQGGRNRAYRGYRQISEGVFTTKGIGELDTENEACSAVTKRKVYDYQPMRFENHHFVHATLSGQRTCMSALTDLNALNVAGTLGTTAGNPVVTQPTGTTPKIVTSTNNPGRYYCMSNDDGVSCGTVTENPNTPSTTIQGTVTRFDGAALTGITAEFATCSPLSTLSPTTYGYSCTVDWSNFINTSWSGKFTFNAGSGTPTLCAAGSSITTVPTDALVSYTINDRSATLNPNSIVFSEVAVPTTSIVLDFNVKSNSCTGLGQPQLSDWSYANNPSATATASLSWPAITDATKYVIRTCNIANPAKTCTPSGTGTETTGTTYTAPAGTTDYKICVNVTAANATTVGSPSSIKCIEYDWNGGKNTRTYKTITG